LPFPINKSSLFSFDNNRKPTRQKTDLLLSKWPSPAGYFFSKGGDNKNRQSLISECGTIDEIFIDLFHVNKKGGWIDGL